jgi:hypothetical protein
MSRTDRIVVNDKDGNLVWLPLHAMLKMTKEKDGKYYFYLINGEKYEISHDLASAIESHLEDGL